MSAVNVSDDFRTLLEEFAYTYLKNQPKDLYKFSAEYFTELYATKTGKADVKNLKPNHELPENEEVVESKAAAVDTQAVPDAAIQSGSENEEDDDVMDMPDLRSRFAAKSNRRQSVASESYDPEKIDFSQIKTYEKTEEQKSRLNEAIKDIFIFKSIEKEQIPRLIASMFEKTVEEGETVIKQGDDGDNFYVIEKGLFDIIKDDKDAGKYENRGSFGELALMYNCPRAATIVARSPGVLWAMDRESFLKIVLHAAFKKRQTYEELLKSASILSPLSDYERTNLADALSNRVYADGDVICHEGDVGDEMFFVVNGEVAAYSKKGADGEEKELRKIEKGGYFGELALLIDGRRNATVKAVKDVKLAVLDRNSFERLLGPCYELMKTQSNAYIEDIINNLGKEAVSQYPKLLELYESNSKAPATEELNKQKEEGEKDEN